MKSISTTESEKEHGWWFYRLRLPDDPLHIFVVHLGQGLWVWRHPEKLLCHLVHLWRQRTVMPGRGGAGRVEDGALVVVVR